MKSQAQLIQEILTAIQNARTICIVGHMRPDGDCIGSQLGLMLALRAIGKQVVCWNQDAMPLKYRFLDPGHNFVKPKSGQEFDLVIAVDCASLERLGTVARRVTRRRQLINIDHHESNTRYGDINWVSAREPSTGELIYHLMKAAGWPVTKPIADCLFTAVSTDTGSFQYASTRPGTFHVGAELVTHGANLARICHEVYQSFPLARVRLLKHVYNKFKLTHNDRIAYFWLKKADLARTGAGSSDTEGLIDHIRAIEPVVVACVFEEIEPETIRISLRSKCRSVNVNDICRQFGGGGHGAAAGAMIAGRPMTIQRRVIGAIRKAINSAN
ncbi:MAG TPA: bifunctional oligoribonuclease/PAP phosphatase NrnA [Verrucomicrobiota bacterium]|nr:bifunctional oligoribonuclease/PAP phosphatase NrnA [Verrucomicrobiota bacterium]HNT14615.1 bifunctional oligoribonuclease/PAP phosphatase NrnA [Verrucomicrobiota bacterium]